MAGKNSIKKKKVALVTGASRGIGAATAVALAKQGYAVCVNYNKSKKAAQTIVDKIIKSGGKAISVKADISKESDIVRMFKEIDKSLGAVSALVNNAGSSVSFSEVENLTITNIKDVFETNIYGTILCSREAVKRMKKNGGGAIVNVSSQAAIFGGNNMAHYAASKAAVNTFTIGFAREVAKYGIRINAVSPGIIDTDTQKGLTQERHKAINKSLPLGRMGRPEEVAETIAWLISDKASYVSGAIIPVSGAR